MHTCSFVARFSTIGLLSLFSSFVYGQNAKLEAGSTIPLPIPTVALGEVAVRVQPRQLTLRAPGEAKGLHDAISHSLAPTNRIAVWHPNPDSGHIYRIRAVRVRLGAREPEKLMDLARHRRQFTEGRLSLHLSPATASGQPAETNLLPTVLLLTPKESEQNQDGWVRFDVAAQRLTLPANGVFVVAEGLTTSPEEQFVRHRTLIRPADGKTPLEDLNAQNRKSNGKGTAVFLYEEVQTAGGGPSRLVRTDQFPAIAHRTTDNPAQCQSWQWWLEQPGGKHSWKSLAVQHAEFRQRNSAISGLRDYNYDLELEVEEL